jgi:hypothetical protein
MNPVTDPDILAQLNAPQRGPVPSTARVWGDNEAEAAGLYETPSAPSRGTITVRSHLDRGKKPVTDPALLEQLKARRVRLSVWGSL